MDWKTKQQAYHFQTLHECSNRVATSQYSYPLVTLWTVLEGGVKFEISFKNSLINCWNPESEITDSSFRIKKAYQENDNLNYRLFI